MKIFYHLWTRIFKKYTQQKTNVFSLLILLLTGFSSLQADDLDPALHRKGAIPLSDTQLQEIQSTWPRVIGVRLNEIGASRIEAFMQEQGLFLDDLPLASSQEEEFLTNQNTDLEIFLNHQGMLAGFAFPPAVDNSILPCFPPIGDQKQQGSSVGWASTYYHATHEYGLLNNVNNKTSSQGIRSPKWAYNMLNFGQDGGAYPQDAYLLLETNGAVGINDFPYDTNYREWDLKTQDWISALSYRMGRGQYINVDVPADIETIKQILNNGHIVTIVTYANSWHLTKVKADPSQEDNPYAGQNAISWMQGMSGGHHTTIVGYNDNVWIDVNNNGRVDAGEKGAFLLANSWGKDWANNGFIWVSYDAFFRNSAVVNGPSSNRQKLAQLFFSVVPKSSNYTPKAVAKFSLSQSVRNQLKVSAGVSGTNRNSPSKTFISGALTSEGGALAFNGQAASLQTATFAMDLTDLLPSTDTMQRYYLITEDSAVGNPTTFNSYSIMDLVNNREVAYTGQGVTFDRSVIQPYIDFQFSNNNTDSIAPTVRITYPTQASTISGRVNMMVNATDNVGVTRVEYYVDSALMGTSSTNPYSLSLDTTTLSSGQHTISVIAYDAAGNRGQDQVRVTIQNSSVDTTPPTVQIQSPGNGATVNGTVTFSAMASNNVGVKQVEFYVDSALQQTVTNPPYIVSVDTTKLTNGQHSFNAVAYDTSNNTARQSISVNINNQGGTLPTVAISSPRNNSVLGVTTFVNVGATAPTGIARVELYLDCKIWDVDFSAPYTFMIDTSKISQAQHVLTAIAYDNEGRSSQNSIIVYIQN